MLPVETDPPEPPSRAPVLPEDLEPVLPDAPVDPVADARPVDEPDDPEPPVLLVVPPAGSVQIPSTQIAVALSWQSLSLEQSRCWPAAQSTTQLGVEALVSRQQDIGGAQIAAPHETPWAPLSPVLLLLRPVLPVALPLPPVLLPCDRPVEELEAPLVPDEGPLVPADAPLVLDEGPLVLAEAPLVLDPVPLVLAEAPFVSDATPFVPADDEDPPPAVGVALDGASALAPSEQADWPTTANKGSNERRSLLLPMIRRRLSR